MKTTLKKAGVVGFGFLLYHGLNAFYALILFPYIILEYGMLNSIWIMFLFLIIFCFFTIKIYDRSKNDWLLIDAIKVKLAGENHNKILKIVIKTLKKGELALLVVVLFWD